MSEETLVYFLKSKALSYEAIALYKDSNFNKQTSVEIKCLANFSYHNKTANQTIYLYFKISLDHKIVSAIVLAFVHNPNVFLLQFMVLISDKIVSKNNLEVNLYEKPE